MSDKNTFWTIFPVAIFYFSYFHENPVFPPQSQTSILARPCWPVQCLVGEEDEARPCFGMCGLILSATMLVHTISSCSIFSASSVFPPWFKDRSHKALLPSALLDNCWVHKLRGQFRRSTSSNPTRVNLFELKHTFCQSETRPCLGSS